jgi:hypothetical protein
MIDDEKDRAIQIEFAIAAVLVAGTFIAGLAAAVRYLWSTKPANHSP